MADDTSDPLGMLSPEERAWLRGSEKTPTPTPTPAPTATQAAPSPQAAAPAAAQADQHWYSGIDAALAPYLMPAQGLHDRATALAGGAYQTLSNAAKNLGLTPAPIPANDQAAIDAHPYWSGAGNIVGGAAATAPLIAGGELLAPAAAAYIPGAAAAGRAYSALSPVIQGAGRGAIGGAWQNALTGNPDEPLWQRGALGAALGGPLGAAGGKIADWFGGFKSLAPDVVDAAQVARREGITNIGSENLPTGSIKSMGAAPDYETGQQINNATSKILGLDLPDYTPTNLAKAKGTLGQAVTKAANSGSIDMNLPLSQNGPNLDQYLTQIESAAQRNGAGGAISPIISDIRNKVQNGVIKGQDFDNLVGNGSVLHDLVGNENPYVKQAAQTLDSAMDAAFKANSPAGAYDNWVDARTKYRALMGIEQNLLPNGYVNPTTLFGSIRNRFSDLKGMPTSSSPVIGRLGELADSIRTLYGGGNPQAPSASQGLIHTLLSGAGIGGGVGAVNYLLGGGSVNPAHLLTPQVMVPAALSAGGAGLRWLGGKYQESQPFINALLARGGRAAGDPLSSWLGSVGTAAAPNRTNP